MLDATGGAADGAEADVGGGAEADVGGGAEAEAAADASGEDRGSGRAEAAGAGSGGLGEACRRTLNWLRPDSGSDELSVEG